MDASITSAYKESLLVLSVPSVSAFTLAACTLVQYRSTAVRSSSPRTPVHEETADGDLQIRAVQKLDQGPEPEIAGIPADQRRHVLKARRGSRQVQPRSASL
jgi:hypothetical protein